MEAHRAVVVAEEMPAATAYDITGHEDLWHLCRAVMGRVPDGSILSMMTHIDSGDEATLSALQETLQRGGPQMATSAGQAAVSPLRGSRAWTRA